MPVRKYKKKVVKRKQKGGNFFSDAGHWIRGAAETVGKGTSNLVNAGIKYVKQHPLSAPLSGLAFVPGFGTIAGLGAAATGAVGYGKRRKIVKKQNGGAKQGMRF